MLRKVVLPLVHPEFITHQLHYMPTTSNMGGGEVIFIHALTLHEFTLLSCTGSYMSLKRVQIISKPNGPFISRLSDSLVS